MESFRQVVGQTGGKHLIHLFLTFDILMEETIGASAYIFRMLATWAFCACTLPRAHRHRSKDIIIFFIGLTYSLFRCGKGISILCLCPGSQILQFILALEGEYPDEEACKYQE